MTSLDSSIRAGDDSARAPTGEEEHAPHAYLRRFSALKEKLLGGPSRGRMTLAEAAIASLVVAAIYVALASVRLNAQGLYYDEVHQATGAFSYCGKKPFFCSLSIADIPILNMTYSGAIKTAIYGAYLRSTGRPFTVTSWRMIGILAVALGIVLFGILARPGMSLGAFLLFAALLLTDTTVLLATRHDWGPVALALGLRLLFIGTWLRGRASGSASSIFLLGTITGLAIFEKLSSLPLCLPLALAMLAMMFPPSPRRLFAGMSGFAVGCLPLLAVNLYTHFTQSRFISFSDVSHPHALSISGFGSFLGRYLAVGEGAGVRGFILGMPSPDRGEARLLPVFGVVVLYLAVARWMQYRRLSAAAYMAASYFLIAVGLYLLPNQTEVHHWIVGTPFQYAAIALCFTELFDADRVRGLLAVPARLAFVCLAGLLISANVRCTTDTEICLMQGKAGLSWHHDLTRVGKAIGRRLDDATLIAADWGIAAQAYCFDDGKEQSVYQPVYDQNGRDVLNWILHQSDKKVCYIAAPFPGSGLRPGAIKPMIRDMASLPGWEEMPLESDLREISMVEVHKFCRTH